MTGYNVLFSKTSSPELDDRLHDVLTKVILPTHLHPQTRKRLYDDKYKDTLKMNPIVIEIEGLEHKFQHMDRFDPTVPNNAAIVRDVVPLMATAADWANLPVLLSGLQRARGPLGMVHKLKIIRQAGRSGNIHAVVDCAARAGKTGFYLTEPETVTALLYWIMRVALDARWEEAATGRAISWAERVLELLESPTQREMLARQSKDLPSMIPLHRDPLALAQVLHLVAVRSVRQHGGQDPDGRVARYAGQVARCWPQGEGLLKLYGDEAYKVVRGQQFLAMGRTQYLKVASPALQGLELAAPLVEPEIAAQLESTIKALRGEVEEVLARDGEKSASGVETYRALFDGQVAAEA
jgi:hypothetical protein